METTIRLIIADKIHPLMSNILTIDDLQRGYLRIQQGKLSIHEWCKMHQSYSTDKDEQSDETKFQQSKISINDLIFPHASHGFYQEIARHILSTDVKIDSIQSDIIIPNEKDRDDAKQSHQKKASSLLDKLKENDIWKKVIEKLQKQTDLST